MTALPVLLFLALGAAAGAIHFLAVAKDAEALVQGGAAMRTIALRLGRLLLTVAVLVLAARAGWGPLLAGAVGLIAARAVVIRRLGPTP